MTVNIKGFILNNEFIPLEKKLSKHRTEKLRKKIEAKTNQQIYFVKQTI
jgi:hypothetical protein